MQRNRMAFNADTLGTDQRKFFSPVSYLQFSMTVPIACQNAHGDLLDVGAGDVPYRQLFDGRVTSYRALDFARHTTEIEIIADAQDMQGIVESDSCDTVLLFEVLEHVRSPDRVIREVHRVLRTGGVVIASVPHLSRLHEEPNDYYRYTRYGLQHLFEMAGFSNIQITPRGGVWSFLGHQVSTALICGTWHIPVMRTLVFWFNKWCVVYPSLWLDRLTDRRKLLALGYIVVAHKST
jgi:SAM-dependent methyltransferase